ncbi:hypothetical protein [Paenibacillus sp.]|uniref:hypothetical protein n=1 Tax=Paenibacillus sp. TaxID=58172 RepID=UPI002D677C16|nr:hypothetical protein [Paenibacillus sp.]HZG55451.1 hypothetical protein [Paenibacillus sp.]
MRMSGIVIGGLLGAAAAMYFSRSNRQFSFSGMGSAGQALDSMVEKARSKMMTPDKRSYYGDNSTSGASSTQTGSSNMSSMSGATTGASSTATASSGLDRVESIVKQDPMLKSQVNEILSENRDTATIR